jgi:hypothetical protein
MIFCILTYGMCYNVIIYVYNIFNMFYWSVLIILVVIFVLM